METRTYDRQRQWPPPKPTHPHPQAHNSFFPQIHRCVRRSAASAAPHSASPCLSPQPTSGAKAMDPTACFPASDLAQLSRIRWLRVAVFSAVAAILDSGDLLPASCNMVVPMLAAFASSEGERATISTRKACAHRPHAPHSGSLSRWPRHHRSEPLPPQHLAVGRIQVLAVA